MLRRRRRRRSGTAAEKKFHHSVYVILLSDRALKESSILRLNPKRISTKPCVYVGLTGLPVDHRFENHKNGYKSARLVKKYGVRLMPELYEHLNPMFQLSVFQLFLKLSLYLYTDKRASERFCACAA